MPPNGTASAGKPVPYFYPGPHGGNLDLNVARADSTVYLPVDVRGALFSMGDVHASMGDGELTGGGIDIFNIRPTMTCRPIKKAQPGSESRARLQT
jgi:acetamidase/formamidase